MTDDYPPFTSVSSDPAERVIVALDGMGPQAALGFATSIPDLLWVKVGLELFVSGGPEVVRTLKDLGKRIFLDLKFHDIPATMAAACRQAACLGADLMTVHALAGTDALQAAQTAALEGAAVAGLEPPRLLAVTVLTSWQQQAFWQQIQVPAPIQTYVSHLADLAAAAGVAGCVCSPQEVRALRSRHSEPFALVTPGIRPAGSDRGDQARVMTPAEALAAGATQLVIGRPITLASDPAAAFAACCQTLAGS
ncbi:MAG: orotidine-5'-phosphate decarboxylase [Prochlorococcaceae cyanobacterium]